MAHKRTGCPVLLRKAGRPAGGRYTLRGPADRSLRLRSLAANTAPARDGRMDAMGRLTARLAHPFYFYVSPVCRCGRKGRQTAGSKGVFNR